jgi:isopentenyl-diphosphate Delta-isomerase
MTGHGSTDELVVLLDEEGNRTGTAPKAGVHSHRTPLHLAFSCYLFDDAGRLLLTRRAEHKRTWPGVWTNSFCGHPGPDEEIAAAVRRRGRQELGVKVEQVVLVLPAFRYEAVMPDGTRENEMCPVFVARVASDTDLRPDPEEVGATEWEDWSTFSTAVLAGERDVSPWCRQQVAELVAALGGSWDGTGPVTPADTRRLPPAGHSEAPRPGPSGDDG